MNVQGATATAERADRTVLLIAAGIVGVVLLTASVVLLAGRSGHPDFPAGSVEETLQHYLSAHEDGDVEATYAFFSSDVQEGMSLDQYRDAIDAFGGYGAQSRSVYFDRITGGGDRVVVHLTVEEFYGGGLQGDTYRSSRDIRMVREQGEWRVDEPLVGLDPAPFRR